MQAELTFPTEWDQTNDMMNDEEVSASSHEEASKVFEQWQTDDQEHDLDIMEVDEQIGSDLLGDEIFVDPCLSPTGPLEEIVLMNVEDEDVDRFSLSLLTDDDNATSALPFEERYKATLKKLSDSMKRSQQTRQSLKMRTTKTEKYSRKSSVTGVLSSIEKSSQQLQTYLKNIQTV